MVQRNKYKRKINLILAIEIILLLLIMICFIWLKNVLIGFYAIMFVAGIFLWLGLLTLTINLKNKIQQE